MISERSWAKESPWKYLQPVLISNIVQPAAKNQSTVQAGFVYEVPPTTLEPDSLVCSTVGKKCMSL